MSTPTMTRSSAETRLLFVKMWGCGEFEGGGEVEVPQHTTIPQNTNQMNRLITIAKPDSLVSGCEA